MLFRKKSFHMDTNKKKFQIVIVFLNNVGNDFVWNLLAILFPVRTIFFSAAIIITKGTVGQQDGEEDNVEVGSNNASIESWQTPKEGSKNFWHVMEVTRNSPPTVQKKQTFSYGISGVVFSDNASGLLSPNDAFSLGLTEDVTLPISIIVDPNHE